MVMGEGWLIDSEDRWIWRFHRDQKGWINEPKVSSTEAVACLTATPAEGTPTPAKGQSRTIQGVLADPGLEAPRASGLRRRG